MLYYGGEIFFEILGDAGGSDQIQKSQSAGLKVQRIARGWLARKHYLRLCLRQATSLIQRSPEGITKMVSDMTLDLNTTSDMAGNVGGSGENCESQSKLSHIRGGGSETQDGK